MQEVFALKDKNVVAIQSESLRIRQAKAAGRSELERRHRPGLLGAPGSRLLFPLATTMVTWVWE